MWRDLKVIIWMTCIGVMVLAGCQNQKSVEPEKAKTTTQKSEEQWVDCWLYSPANETHQHPDYGKKCGLLDEYGRLVLTADFLALKPHFGSDNLGCTSIGVDKDGKPQGLGSFRFTKNGIGRGHDENLDFGCQPYDYSGGGILKTYVKGRLAFHDDDMNIVRQTDYVFGQNFYDGKALVCTKRPVLKWGTNYEHPAWADGICGEIDENFEIITAIDRPYEYYHPLPAWIYEGYLLYSEIETVPGKAPELIALLEGASTDMPGNNFYRINSFKSSPNVVWISEGWDSKTDHIASLNTPKVQEAMVKGRLFIKSITRKIESDQTNVNPVINSKSISDFEAKGLKSKFERYAIVQGSCEQNKMQDYKQRVNHYCELKNRENKSGPQDDCAVKVEESLTGGAYQWILERCGHLH